MPAGPNESSSCCPPPALHTVTVRALCEFTAMRGDLDRRFSPSATALEGIRSQQLAASRRGNDYEAEVALEACCEGLLVRGRADGWDPRRRTLEEFKTIRGDPQELPENRRQLHWAQLVTYAALFCRCRQLEEVAVALVYVDAASQAETELRQVFGVAELELQLRERCLAFTAWAQQEGRHRAQRDAALQQLGFPLGEFRPGQRLLAESVFRAARQGRCLVAQAPTGIGKTMGTLYPLLRGMPQARTDKVAFLTCKGTGRETALQALQVLRQACCIDGDPQPPLRVLAMVSREQACEHPDKACHPQSCPLAAGFYDRLPAARTQAVETGWLDAATQRRIALQYSLCPYHLGQELQRWADVLVGDVHHLLAPAGQLRALQHTREWRLSVLVDEAHNLAERARQMYSARLDLDLLQRAAQSAPAAITGLLTALHTTACNSVQGLHEDYSVLEECPVELGDAISSAVAAMADLQHQQPLAQGAWLPLHFELQHFQRLLESLGEHTLLDVSRSPQAHNTGATITLRNVVPAGFLRPRWAALQHATLFSATTGPQPHAVALLGLPEDTAWVDVPPAFAPENLRIRIARQLSTRYAHRDRSLAGLTDVLEGQFSEHPGNYLAFFSSFDYLERAADALQHRHPDVPQWRQERNMDAAARQAFLDRFTEQGQGIGFAVLGGVFGEGVDLPGKRLIGAFIATLGLPPVSPMQEAIAQRLQSVLGGEPGEAERIAALQRVVQAAGRVLRTPDDHGWLWLLDDRYTRPQVQALLPRWWQLG